MVKHVESHTRSKRMQEFICSICEKQFVSERTLNQHIDLLHKNSFALKKMTNVHRSARTVAQGTFPCRFCKITLSSLRGLGHHERFCERLWNQKEATFQSVSKNETTDGQTHSQSDLKSNEELIETFNAALRCPKCKRYYRKDKLKQHTMSCEQDAKNSYS